MNTTRPGHATAAWTPTAPATPKPHDAPSRDGDAAAGLPAQSWRTTGDEAGEAEAEADSRQHECTKDTRNPYEPGIDA